MDTHAQNQEHHATGEKILDLINRIIDHPEEYEFEPNFIGKRVKLTKWQDLTLLEKSALETMISQNENNFEQIETMILKLKNKLLLGSASLLSDGVNFVGAYNKEFFENFFPNQNDFCFNRAQKGKKDLPYALRMSNFENEDYKKNPEQFIKENYGINKKSDATDNVGNKRDFTSGGVLFSMIGSPDKTAKDSKDNINQYFKEIREKCAEHKAEKYGEALINSTLKAHFSGKHVAGMSGGSFAMWITMLTYAKNHQNTISEQERIVMMKQLIVHISGKENLEIGLSEQDNELFDKNSKNYKKMAMKNSTHHSPLEVLQGVYFADMVYNCKLVERNPEKFDQIYREAFKKACDDLSLDLKIPDNLTAKLENDIMIGDLVLQKAKLDERYHALNAPSNQAKLRLSIAD